MQLKSITDIGAKRKDNQDNYWSALLNIDGMDAGVICLCDGMGGLSNGGLASKIVVESVKEGILEGIPFKELDEIIMQANKTVYGLGQDEQSAMGTTCTILQCYGGKYDLWHVGDSRCYLQRGNTFKPITVDHSALREYGITKEADERLYKKYKNSLTRCIGVKPDVQIDYYSGSYMKDDLFFVCSDGMWHYLSQCQVSREDLLNLDELVKSCINYGETDNITAGVLVV